MPPKLKPKKPTSSHSQVIQHLKNEQKKLYTEQKKLETEQRKVVKALKILGTSSHGSSSGGKKKKKTSAHSSSSGKAKHSSSCTSCGPTKTIAKKEKH